MAKTAQVNGQMELNFTEQKFPKKRSIAKKSVSKPKKEIKKQIAFSCLDGKLSVLCACT